MRGNGFSLKNHTVKLIIVCLVSVFCFVVSFVYVMDLRDLLLAYDNGKVMSETVSYLDTLSNPQNTFRPSTDVMLSGVLRLVVMLTAAFVFVKYIIDRKSTVSKSNTLAALLIAANAGTMLTSWSGIITPGFFISIAANVIFIALSICIVVSNYSKRKTSGVRILLGICALAAFLSLMLCDTRIRIIEPICSLVIAVGCCLISIDDSEQQHIINNKKSV